MRVLRSRSDGLVRPQGPPGRDLSCGDTRIFLELEVRRRRQLWSYEREGWARRFFENWRASLKWRRLTPYEKFAVMIDRHWDGIAAYCRPDNKVSLGFVEGLNNKIRVIQRRAYGLRDETSAAQDPHLHAADPLAAQGPMHER